MTLVVPPGGEGEVGLGAAPGGGAVQVRHGHGQHSDCRQTCSTRVSVGEMESVRSTGKVKEEIRLTSSLSKATPG